MCIVKHRQYFWKCRRRERGGHSQIELDALMLLFAARLMIKCGTTLFPGKKKIERKKQGKRSAELSAGISNCHPGEPLLRKCFY